MWVGAVSLSNGIKKTRDDEGFTKETIVYGNPIPANITDSTRDDVTLASQRGYNADLNVEIISAAYTGNGYFRDESTGLEYSIVRTFKRDRKNTIVITGEVRERGKI